MEEKLSGRSVGLDAMDLLKNLLFMSAKPNEFSRLKDIWKKLTDEIYGAREKPLRFLRYYLFATYKCDPKLREDGIYDWFIKNDAQTRIKASPVAFSESLFEGAKAYKNFTRDQNAQGQQEAGISNTRYLGGKSIRQHFILLLAGRKLPKKQFSDLASQIEKTMCVWLITNTPGKDYERLIVEWAGKLRSIKSNQFDNFARDTFVKTRKAQSAIFDAVLKAAKKSDMRSFRVRYLIAKFTQHIDVQAYGDKGGYALLSYYIDSKNDIEHILPENPSSKALLEFGVTTADQEIIQRLGNLLLVEESVNRSIKNDSYSAKRKVYPSSQFLLTRQMGGSIKVGKNGLHPVSLTPA